MSLTGKTPPTSRRDVLLRLNNEAFSDKKAPWNKLTKFQQLRLINQYALEYLEKNKNNCGSEDEIMSFFRQILSRRKLVQSKDLNYDEENNKIIEIFGLTWKEPPISRFFLINDN